MKTLNTIKYVMTAILVLTMNARGFAQDSQEQGYKIALEAQKRSKGFSSLTVNMTMILKALNQTVMSNRLFTRTLNSRYRHFFTLTWMATNISLHFTAAR